LGQEHFYLQLVSFVFLILPFFFLLMPVLLTNSVEAQADYILKFCNRWQTEGIHSFVPRSEAVADFMRHAERILQTTVWVDSCRSWYKSSTKDNSKLLAWPGSGLHFIEALSDPRYDDYEFTYCNNDRFAWLGNGYSQIELDPSADRAFYIRTHDDGPILGRVKRLKNQVLKSEPENKPVDTVPDTGDEGDKKSSEDVTKEGLASWLVGNTQAPQE
jgi:hypothetical protein